MDSENPYAKMTFDPQGEYKKAKTELKSSFDASVQEAGEKAGMAAGVSGRNAGRVTADVMSRALSEKDKAAAGLDAQEAGAKTQFETWKATKSAEFEQSKPGVFDVLGSVVNIGADIAGTVISGGLAAPKLIADVGKQVMPKDKPLVDAAPTLDVSKANNFGDTYDWSLNGGTKKKTGLFTGEIFNQKW